MAIRSSKSKGDQVIKVIKKHLEEGDYTGKLQKNKRRYETHFLLFEIAAERNRKAVYTVSLEVQRAKREEDIDSLGQSILNYHLLQRNVEETKIK